MEYKRGKQQMKLKHEDYDIVYQPILLIIGTFAITWCCAGLMTKTDYDTHTTLFTFLDFMENASPLFCTLILFRKYLTRDKLFRQFFFGKTGSTFSYVIVFLYLARHPGWVFTKQQIYEAVWHDPEGDCNTAITNVISQIRKKLNPYAPKNGYIKTVVNSGYKFEAKIT